MMVTNSTEARSDTRRASIAGFLSSLSNNASTKAESQPSDRRASVPGVLPGFLTKTVQGSEKKTTHALDPDAHTNDVPGSNTSIAEDEAAHVPTIDGIRATASAGLDATSRPFHWRILLGIVSCENASSPQESGIVERRAQYHQIRKEFQSYRHGEPPRPHEPPPLESKTSRRGSVAKESPHYHDISLMKEIEKDVSRTQSDLSFFQVGGISQQWMLRILFVYAKLHPELGYMQGMNEILAPLVYVFGSDTNDEWADETEADAFAAFTEIMSSVKLLYAKSPKDPSKTGVDMQMTRLMLLLRQHDALLWQHLNSIGLSPDFYSFRWYMTLLAREFPMAMTLRVWDSLLADPKRFSFLHYVCCALLRSQRKRLLKEGFTGALKLLQTLVDVDVEQVLHQAQQMRDKDRSTDHHRRLLFDSENSKNNT